ncbi:MAG: adenosylcobinamide-phosphate synthase CbiB [Bryobacteraceae bacterium]
MPVRVTSLQLLAGVALDLLFADPGWLPHPVRGLGWTTGKWEGMWRSTGMPLRWAGLGFAVSTIAVAVTVVLATAAWLPQPWANIYWIFSLLALRGLDLEAARVIGRLRAGDLEGARSRLSMIVGRDTLALDEPEIVRAAIETVAENLSDAVIAPLFYLALGGPAAMAAYKAVNTLDSMVGYRNQRYREFGWASARMDDAANFVPARLSAGLVWLAALVTAKNAARSVRVTLRDAHRQPSPNSGYPEAAVAGALGVRLGGLNFYGGISSWKEYLGDPIHPLDARAFAGTRRLLYVSSLLFVAILSWWLPWEWA